MAGTVICFAFGAAGAAAWKLLGFRYQAVAQVLGCIGEILGRYWNIVPCGTRQVAQVLGESGWHLVP